MPTNLQALIRYRTIDNCLKRRGIRWTWKELANECGDAIYYFTGTSKVPSRRTIMYDLDNMKNGKLGYFAPIEYDRIEKTYYYSDPSFSISNTPLNQDDMGELNHALTILKQFSGFKHVEGIENIITKLEHTVNLKSHEAKEVIQFDHQLNAPGQKWLDKLYQAIQSEQCVKLEYQPFNVEAPFDKIISPYLLKEYNRRWFLIAYDHEREQIQNYGLDRIKKMMLSNVPFVNLPDFNADTYFNNIIGVSIPKDGQLEEIILEAKSEQAEYIKTKPLHVSQSIVNDGTTKTVFSYQLIINYELTSLILSFGEKVKVIKPKLLLETVRQRLNEGASNYFNNE